MDALCEAAGGPCLYTGRAMKPVHAGLGISDGDWTTFIGILSAALSELERRFKPDLVEAR